MNVMKFYKQKSDGTIETLFVRITQSIESNFLHAQRKMPYARDAVAWAKRNGFVRKKPKPPAGDKQ